MAKYRISHDAQADIVDILRFTHNRFGDAARRCYQALIGTALEAVATDPLRLGSLSREEGGQACAASTSFTAARCPTSVRLFGAGTSSSTGWRQLRSPRWFACFTTRWIWINTCLLDEQP